MRLKDLKDCNLRRFRCYYTRLAAYLGRYCPQYSVGLRTRPRLGTKSPGLELSGNTERCIRFLDLHITPVTGPPLLYGCHTNLPACTLLSLVVRSQRVVVLHTWTPHTAPSMPNPRHSRPSQKSKHTAISRDQPRNPPTVTGLGKQDRERGWRQSSVTQ